MSRPLRQEYTDALYHVTSRGDRREDIYDDETDRQIFLSIIAEGIEQINWLCYAYCLMDNHYHLLVQTPDANLSQGMRQLNGVYTQAYNRRHGKTGSNLKPCFSFRPYPVEYNLKRTQIIQGR